MDDAKQSIIVRNVDRKQHRQESHRGPGEPCTEAGDHASADVVA